MNHYASAKDGDFGSGFSLIHSSSHHANAIVVPDAELLFTGNFHRAGLDLVLTGHDGRHHVIPGYFASEHPPALVAPNGAHLSPDIVDLLAGSAAPNEYAQAQTQTQAGTAPDSVGKVQKVAGTVTVLRNGVSVALNVGDVVYKSDVLVTGADSKCGLTFPDGTALELLPNTRMALNEYAYDANSTSNQALFTLVEGTFGFVAGKVAHTGDMKIGTPVATMGIRGTTGVVQEVATINATSGNVTYSYSVYDDPGSTTSGSWDMSVQNPDGSYTVIATVSQTGYVTFVTPQGIGRPPLVSTVPMTASQVAADQLIIQELFETYGLAGPHAVGQPGSGDDPLLQAPPNFFPENPGPNGPYAYNYQLPDLPSLPGLQQNPLFPPNPTTPSGTADVFIWPTGTGTWPTGPKWLAGTAPINSSDVVIIESGDVQYDLNLTIFSLTIDGPGELDIVGGGLTLTSGLDVAGLLLVEGDPPILTTYGTVTVESGGKIVSSGIGAVIDFFSADPSNPSKVDNFGTIAAKHGGDVTFLQVLVTNEAANAGNTDPDVTTPAGKIVSTGCGSVIDFTNVNFDNAGVVIAKDSGGVFFVDAAITNDTGAEITAKDHGTIAFATSEIVGNGTVQVDACSTLDLEDSSISRGTVNVYGTLHSTGTSSINDASINNTGTLVASCGTLTIDPGSIDNSGLIEANGGALTIVDTPVTNSGTLEATHGGTLTLSNTTITNNGTGATFIAASSEETGGGINNAQMEADLLTNSPVNWYTADPPNTDTRFTFGANDSNGWIEINLGQIREITDIGTTITQNNRPTTGPISIEVSIDGITFTPWGSPVPVSSSTTTVDITEPLQAVEYIIFNYGPTGNPYNGFGGSAVSSIFAGVGPTGLNLITNSTGTVLVDAGSTLDLEGSGISGGTVDVYGTLDSTGTSSINDASITNTGTLVASSGTLTIDPGSIDNSGLLEANGGALTIDATPVINSGTLEATGGGALTLSSDSVTNTGGTVEVAFGSVLYLQDSGISGGTVSICGTMDSTGASTISDATTTIAAGAIIESTGGTLQIYGGTIENYGTLEASHGGTLLIDDIVQNHGGNAIIAGGTLDFVSKTDVNEITFDNGSGTPKYGELILGDVSGGYSATINGFAGTASNLSNSDGIDLTNFVVTHESETTTTGGIVTLELYAGSERVSLTFDDFAGTLIVGSDGHSGTLITDPPTASSDASGSSSPSADDVGGNVTFAGADRSDTESATITPNGSDYIGSVSLGQVSESNGSTSVNWQFSVDNDQINLAPGETLTQSYNVSINDAQNPAASLNQNVAVSIGGSGNDNFVFAPGMGADKIVNFNPGHDTIELDHFTNAQTMQELQSLITADVHGDAIINFGHNDSITLANTTTTQLQQAIQAGHVLLH
jgi:adhesin HecA-like repeat protein